MYANNDDRFPNAEQVPPPIGANEGMSGRFVRQGVIFSRPGRPRLLGLLADWIKTAAPRRLLACAFAASLLLHAALLLPYPFANFNIGGPGTFATEKSRPAELHLLSLNAARANIPTRTETQDHAATEAISAATRGVEHEPMPPISDARFFDANTLDKRPRAMTERLPGEENFSLIAPSGAMRLNLWIDERGEVVHVTVERGDLPPDFGELLAAAFREIRFEPGERDGRPVGSILKVEVSYSDPRRSSS